MTQNDDQTSGKKDEQCPTAKDLLDQVTVELAKYEAKKLGELKTELEAFVKKQDGLVTEYKSKYPVLRKLWCDRQLDVERLCAHIKCEFPLTDERWKKLIEECICKHLHKLCCLEQRIVTRKKCCSGPLQRARDTAQATFDAAKKRLDLLANLASKIDGILAENLKLVAEIEKPTERPVALYLYYFKLRPSHMHLAPYDASEECMKVCCEGDPNTLCCDIYKEGCPEDDGRCTPKDGKMGEGCKQIPEVDGPWLMSPDKYRNALDCAWQDYHKAKEVLAEAEAAFKKEPDDLDSLIKRQADEAKGLDETIKKCLKDVKPKDDCCKEPEPKKGC